MSKKKNILSFVILITSNCFAGNPALKIPVIKDQVDSLRFAGSIAEKYAFTMVFKLNGNIVNGWYYYDSRKQRINITGTLKNGSFEIAEYTGKDTTGFFSGNMADPYHIEGSWRRKRDIYNDTKFFEAIEKRYVEEMNAAISSLEKNTTTKKIKIISTNKDGDMWLNEVYLKNCKEQVKAILAFYSTLSGSDCWWEGDHPNAGYSNLSCRFTKTLGLGWQCSDKQKSIIKKWFGSDNVLLEEADNCYSAPNTATSQASFDELTLEILEDKIVVKYTTAGANIREDYSWTFKGIGIYKLYSQKIVREYYK